MNVNEIRDRVLEISHNEAAPDTDLENRALRWLNSAYHELIDEILPFMADSLTQEETLSVSAGVGVLGNAPHRILRVIDSANSFVLNEVTRSEVVDIDPAQSHSGNAKRFWVNGTKLSVHPAATVQLKVLYVPVAADLVEGGAENTVLLPTSFHNALVWGALVWASTFERGFSSQADMRLFQSKWEEAKRAAKLSLASKPSSVMRTKPFLG